MLKADGWRDLQRKHRMCVHCLEVKNTKLRLLPYTLSLLFYYQQKVFCNDFNKIDSGNIWALHILNMYTLLLIVSQ